MLEQAILAGGCFWGLQAKLKALNGVSDTLAVYTGGTVENPSYAQVCRQQTGHVEAVQLNYDTDIISYTQLLEAFFQSHNPILSDTFGEQYRSTIFYLNEEQKAIAEQVMASVDAANIYPEKIRTVLRPASQVWPAEEYHQDYYAKNNVVSDDDCYCR
jgi:methionine-S-sulfoxide reductase